MRLFKKHEADHKPLALATIAEAHCLDAKRFVRQYREHLSDFSTWTARTHAAEWLVFLENVEAHLSLNEVASGQDELDTVLTNKARHGKHGARVAIVKDTTHVSAALRRIPGAIRETAQTVTRDLDASMAQIATTCFLNAQQIEDRFHVHQRVSEALQEIRIALRKEAITEDNAKSKSLGNGGATTRPLATKMGIPPRRYWQEVATCCSRPGAPGPPHSRNGVPFSSASIPCCRKPTTAP